MVSTDRLEQSGGPSAAQTSRAGVLAAAASWLLCWLVLGYLTASNARLPDVDADWHAFGYMDYRDTVWVPLRDFAAGHIPWDTVPYQARHPFSQEFLAYLPSYWYFLAPLHLLPYRASVFLWTGVETGLVAWLAHESVRRLAPGAYRRAPWTVALLTLFLVGTRPAKVALVLGNLAIVCAVGAALALLQVPGGRTPRGAVVATVLALVKPPVGLPLVVLQATSRRWRPALAGLVITGLLSLPVFAVVFVRAGGLGAGLRLMIENLANRHGRAALELVGHPTTEVHSLSLLHNAQLEVPSAVSMGLLALTALACFGVHFISARRHGVLDPRTVTLAGLALVLVTPNIVYALVACTPGLVALAASAWRERGIERWFALLALGLLGLAFALPARLLPMLGASSWTTGVVVTLSLLLAWGVCAAWALRRPVSKRPNLNLS